MKKLSLLLFVFCIISCNKIEKSDLTVIDKVELGKDKKSFYKQFDSLSINPKLFYTDLIFFDSESLEKSKINIYISQIFNTQQYLPKNESTNHYGIFYPVQNFGTENIIGLKILLVHTCPSMLITNGHFYKITDQSKIFGISQNIRIDLIDNIQEMLISKYGKPTEILKPLNTDLYKFENGSIKTYTSDSLHMGELVTWKTKYLNICLFKGFRSYRSVYTPDGYNETYFEDNNHTQKLQDNEIATYSLPYISYTINEETISKLKLDKINL